MSLKKENTNPIIAIVVTIITALVFSFLFLFLGINHRRDVYNDSKKLAIEISRKAAFETQVYLSSAMINAKSIEQKARKYRAGPYLLRSRQLHRIAHRSHPGKDNAPCHRRADPPRRYNGRDRL